MTPQLNAYNYSNYKGYNNTGKALAGIKNSLKIALRKSGYSVTVNILDVIKNITRDPHSNYTVGLFQIAQVLTEGLKKENMTDITIDI